MVRFRKHPPRSHAIRTRIDRAGLVPQGGERGQSESTGNLSKHLAATGRTGLESTAVVVVIGHGRFESVEVDERLAVAEGVSWDRLFPAEGVHCLQPNRPFALDAFLDLSNEQLQEWSDGVCNAFSRHKVLKGNVFRYAPRPRVVCDVDEVLAMLRQAGSTPDVPEHAQRQALLLADIAGFD